MRADVGVAARPPVRPVSGVESRGPVRRHVGALDGLRGAAVAGVLVFHGGHLTGGYLGVDLFFVLSGFLITSLLLQEADRTEQIGLGGFWSRRARRLLPALVGMLAGVALYSWLIADPTQLGRIRGDALATLGYVANWRFIFAGFDYWALFSAPSPLEHTWSLAIEEQFYLVWPLVLTGLLVWTRRTRPVDTAAALARRVLVVSLVGAVVASVLMATMVSAHGSTTRAYYGTDTRASSILVGAALAALLFLRGPARVGAARVASQVGAVLGAVALAALWADLHGDSLRLYRGGFLLGAVAAAAMIAVAVDPREGPLSRALSWRPLRGLGIVSYGVYLWHWPVYVVLDHQRTGLGDGVLLPLRIAVTVAIACVSFYALERPIRRGALSAHFWRLAAPATAVVLVFALVVSTLGERPSVAAGDSASSSVRRVTGFAQTHPGAKKVLVIGNSVGFFLSKGIADARPQAPFAVLNGAFPACTFPPASRVQFSDHSVHEELPCDVRWAETARSFRPDVVVLALAGLGPGALEHDGQWLEPCSSAFAAWFHSELTRDLQMFRALGARTVLLTAAYTQAYGQLSGVRETDCGNAALERAAAAVPGTSVADVNRHLCPHDRSCVNVQGGVVLRPDGVHYKGRGAVLIARWLLPYLEGSRPRPSG